MSDTVKKLFTILIVVVICIVVGAFAINIIVPNSLTSLTNAVEDTMFSATGLSIDLNGDGTAGTDIDQDGKVRTDNKVVNEGAATEQAGHVQGFTSKSGGNK